MILRRITKHVNDQNWFAVGLDFFIVVFGVGMALAAGEWLNTRAQKADLATARLAINEDLAIIYANALERLALKDCRIAQVQSIADQLKTMDQPWTGIPAFANNSAILGNLDGVMRSSFRSWPSGSWEAAKSRGLLTHMKDDQRQAIEGAFTMVPIAVDLQNTIFQKQSLLKALTLEADLTPSDRLRYYDVLAEVDAASALLEIGSGNTIIHMETTFEQVAPETLAVFHDYLRETNAVGPLAYGDCYHPITLPNVVLTPESLDLEP